MKKCRLILMIAALLMGVTSAKALEQDGAGNYLIGSVQDWKEFATLVQTTPTANAKMTADIDLGDDQTVIGGTLNGSTLFYGGTFDGQGHTLTIAYKVTNEERFASPFSLIEGATIRNLHLDGTVNSVYAYGGSISSILRGTNTIENVWNSVTNVCTNGGWAQVGTFIGVLDTGASATVSDCLYTGSNSITGIYCGYFNATYGPAPTFNNCLVLGTFTEGFGFNGTYNNCFCKHATTTGVTQPSDGNLSDGTTTTNLNNGRTGDAAPWVQEGSQPMLKQFTLQKDGDNYYQIGNAAQWKQFASIINNGSNAAANAKMTADINLGNDKTMVGTNSSYYQGVFDGQGHTITINFEVTENYLGLFRYISGATIKNLHATGTISTSYYGFAGGIVGVASGACVIQNCQSSVNIQSTIVDGEGILGGFVACTAPENSGATLNINDCLFNGSMNGPSTKTCSGFVAWRYDGNTVNISNSIFLPTSANVHSTYSACFVGHYATSLTNCYHKTVIGTVQGDEATAANLSDGTTTTALNNGRLNGPWVQDAVSGEPRLDVFMTTTSLTANEGKTGEYWSTYYNGAKSCIADANTTVYTGALNGDKIDLTEVADKTIPAGNAVILKSTAANITLTKTSATGTLAGNGLMGTDADLVNPGNAYCLSKNASGVVGFYKFTASGTIPAHRAYIVIPSSARSFYGFDDDDTTSLEEVPVTLESEEDSALYDLTGRMVTGQPRKGIYVRNGKKIIIK